MMMNDITFIGKLVRTSEQLQKQRDRQRKAARRRSQRYRDNKKSCQFGYGIRDEHGKFVDTPKVFLFSLHKPEYAEFIQHEQQ
jgi:hypothetical protein